MYLPSGNPVVSTGVLVGATVSLPLAQQLLVSKLQQHPSGNIPLEVKNTFSSHTANVILDKGNLFEDKEYKGMRLMESPTNSYLTGNVIC